MKKTLKVGDHVKKYSATGKEAARWLMHDTRIDISQDMTSLDICLDHFKTFVLVLVKDHETWEELELLKFFGNALTSSFWTHYTFP